MATPITIDSSVPFGQPNLELYYPVTRGVPIDPILFVAQGGDNLPSYEWAFSGNLPEGLTFSQRRAMAEITGTPTATYSYRFNGTVRARDTKSGLQKSIPVGFELFQPTPPPHNDHTDHSDVHTDVPAPTGTHGDHSDSSTVYVDSTTAGTHSDVRHSDHGDHSDTPPVHVDLVGRLHVDHLDAVVPPKHSDVVPPHIDSPPAQDIKVRFDPPGGPTPDIVDFIYKRGQEGDREKSYRVTNFGESTMKIVFHNMPRGVEIVPEIVTVEAGEFDSFVVKLTQEFFEGLGIGTTRRALDIRMELIGEPIRP